MSGHCGHCGRPLTPQSGYGFARGVELCHTGTMPPTADPPDCYRLVTVWAHKPDGACCRPGDEALIPLARTLAED